MQHPPRPRWLPGVSERLGYYVYTLCDPRKGDVFYVGKGTGDRCFSHLAEARSTSVESTRNYGKLDRIREIEATGEDVEIRILRSGLDEQAAFLVESVAIDCYGLEQLDNRTGGYGSGVRSVESINASLGAPPAEFSSDDRFILVKLAHSYHEQMSDEDLYVATSRFWRVSKRWLDPADPKSPRFAAGVYQGIIRVVYRIERWRPPTESELADHIERGIRWVTEGKQRWAFEGKVDRDQMERFFLTDVTDRFPNPSLERVYVNCGPEYAPPSSATRRSGR